MNPNGIRDDAASIPEGEILRTVRSWNSLHGSSGICTPGCICSLEVDQPEPCGDRERDVTYATEGTSSAAAATEAVWRAAAAATYAGGSSSALTASGGGSSSVLTVSAGATTIEASSSGVSKTDACIPPAPLALNLGLRLPMPSTSVGGATPVLWSPTLTPFSRPSLPQTGACSPDCSCPWGYRCFDSTRA